MSGSSSGPGLHAEQAKAARAIARLVRLRVGRVEVDLVNNEDDVDVWRVAVDFLGEREARRLAEQLVGIPRRAPRRKR